MFCTLGTEILRVLAISAPVLPASNNFFTSARVSSVIFARVRVFFFFFGLLAALRA